MSQTLRIFIACAMGAGIEALIALQLQPYLLWIGLIAGGLVGYFSYDFKTVLMALKTAGQKTVHWRSDWQFWKACPILQPVMWGIILTYSWLLI